MSHTHTKPHFLISSSPLKAFVIVFFVLLLMASSSSLSCSWLYHVFLSFRGVDVRKGFLSHVMKEFKSKGIMPFVDNEIKRGDSVGPVLVEAIRQSRVAIVLLSRNYASSSWCLDELVEIMKCREEDQQTVMTIFYEVDPSDVRKQTGDFGKAFDKTCVGKEEKVKQAWRQALKDVASIAGYHSSNCGSEAELINRVASDVTAVLGFTPSKDFDDFVGIEAHITKIKLKLILQSEKVKVIGILGPAGIGKTTTARVLYNQLFPGFPFSTFLENIRGSYEKPCGNDYRLKLRLQNNLLSQIFNQRDIEVHHLGGAREKLSDKKVLVVLDEVDSWWQLEEMAKQRGWVGPGSIIIITTEDRKLLKALRPGVDHIYEMEFPTDYESLQIFCQYAFGQKSPEIGFETLAREVTWLAGNLPLGLRVMGSYLRGMSKNEWIDALPRLRSSLDRETESTLKLSYNGLSDKDKALFLHIACFFVGENKNRVKICLEKSGLDVNHGLQILEQKSLISIKYGVISTSEDHGIIEMHSLLQQMGKKIVYEQPLEERQFLWDTNDINDVLNEVTSTGKVLGIRLNASEGEEIRISKRAFDGMKNLQFLDVYSNSLCISEGLNCLPDKLRLIFWDDCPLTFWPSKFSGKFLVKLIMQYSRFEKLWEGIKPLQCLKLMDLSYSHYLKEIPDLLNATSLEELHLSGCSSLLELTSSIGNAPKLKVCKLDHCWVLKELPSSIGSLISLKELCFEDCPGLKALNIFSSLEKVSGCSSLRELSLSYTVIEEAPLSMKTWSCLYKMNMTGCRNLKEFPLVPDSIVELKLSLTRIEEIPPWIENLFRLRKLYMYGCEKLKTISPNISNLENLEFLILRASGYNEYNDEDVDTYEAVIDRGPNLERRWKLRSDFGVHHILPICLPAKAQSLCLRGNRIKTIPDCIRRLSGLTELDIEGCIKLVALPPLPGSLLSINAKMCRSLKRIDSTFQNPNICLNFTGCTKLNRKARKLIQTSACKYAVLPGEEVPTHFTHRASSGSLTINLTPKPLPPSFRIKACILLSNHMVDFEDQTDNEDEEDENSLMDISCCVRGKQNGHTVQYLSDQLHRMPSVDGFEDDLYLFDVSFTLNQDYPESHESTFSELFLKFIVHYKTRKVKGCGVRFLEVPNCILDGNAYGDVNNGEEDESYEGDKDESDDDDGEGSDCLNLNQKTKKLIQSLYYESALVQGVEVPAYFTHQSTSASLTINMTPMSLPSSFRFKACILLSRYSDDVQLIRRLFYHEEDEDILMNVSCRGEQNGLSVSYGSKQRDMPYLYGYEDYLYTFEDSFFQDDDFPEAEVANISNLMFQFEVCYKKWEVKGCGVQLCEVPHYFIDGKVTEEGEEMRMQRREEGNE